MKPVDELFDTKNDPLELVNWPISQRAI